MQHRFGQHRVIFGAPAQNLNYVLDLVVATDHRIQVS
jgi:hypothetical protein